MEIYYKNSTNKIREIVEKRAKYQKVMLLYDNSVSTIKISEMCNLIKEICIYNHMDISKCTKADINDGYKLVIWICGANSYLKYDLTSEEFINVFCPQDEYVLPFLLLDSKPLTSESYLLLDEHKLDVIMTISLYMNRFYNYFNNLLTFNTHKYNMFEEILLHDVKSVLSNLDDDMEFLDIDILKKTNLSYEDIPLVDLLLIDAMLVLLTSIKNQSVSLVDVYKVAKNDMALIEKFYKLYFNDTFKNLIILNYNCLINFCNKTKEKIMEGFRMVNIDTSRTNEIIKKFKDYAKQDDGIVAYLSLYNIFNG